MMTIDKNLGVASESIALSMQLNANFQLLIVSNKGLMKLRTGVALEETTILIKPLTIQDLLQKHNGAQKLQKYFDEFRIGYINADGKRRVNPKVFEEINRAVSVLKPENITDIEAMDDEELDQFQQIVSQMIATVVQVKKLEATPQKKVEISSSTPQEYLLQVELQLSNVMTKLLRMFNEAAHKDQARKEEAYKNRVIKDIQLCEQIKSQALKKWDILMSTLKTDLLIYAQKSVEIDRQKLDFSLLHPKNILGNIAAPVA